MAETFEYALMSGNAYRKNRHENNWIPRPEGWEDLSPLGGYQYDSSTGFEAVAYRKGNEIVIAFAGTDQPQDWYANVGMGLGFFGLAQLKQAAAFYARIQAQYGDGVTYTFTGHSLGGGIAALMGVFFNKTAVTFDPAPFEQTANNDTRTILRDYLAGQSLLSPSLAGALDSFWSSLTANGEGASAQPGIRGEGNVSITSVQGEALLSVVPSMRIGFNPTLIRHAGTAASGIDLHSITLLAAMKKVPGLAQAAEKLPELLPLIFDPSLYLQKTTSEQTSFLELLLRREVGIGGAAGDGMLTHFAADLQRVGTFGRDNDATLRSALITFALQAYHNQESGFTKELFESVSGGIRADISLVADQPGNNEGYIRYFQDWLWPQLGGQDAISQFGSQFASTTDWYLAGKYLSAQAKDKAAFMLGAGLSDNLTGSTQADLLVGLGGNDFLDGRGGDDTLIGGDGTDTYVYRLGDGSDRIVDSDKKGRIQIVSADGTKTYNASVFTKNKDNPNEYLSPDEQVKLVKNGTGYQLQAGGGTSAYVLRDMYSAYRCGYPARTPDPCAHGPSNSRNEREWAAAFPEAARTVVESGTMKPANTNTDAEVSRGGTPGNGTWRLSA